MFCIVENYRFSFFCIFFKHSIIFLHKCTFFLKYLQWRLSCRVIFFITDHNLRTPNSDTKQQLLYIVPIIVTSIDDEERKADTKEIWHNRTNVEQPKNEYWRDQISFQLLFSINRHHLWTSGRNNGCGCGTITLMKTGLAF